MKCGSSTHAVLAGGLLLAILTPAFAKSDPADPNRYLNAVREFADNVLKYGRDTYGPKHTPLFVDGLNIHTHEPVKWIAPNGDRWILSNLASQQNLFRTLDGLTRITGDPKYKQAAMDAIKYAFENLRSPNGLVYWGGHSAYDAAADRPCGGGIHELKSLYPFYELMWEVDPRATKQFIEAFWAAHILDWSNLDMNRHGNMNAPVGKVWSHEYKGGPVFFESKGLSFSVTGSDLSYGAALLSKLAGDRQPLVWAKRLSHRYVETRNPKIGISSYTYTRNNPSALQELLGDDFKRDLLVYGMEFPGYWRIVDWTCPLCQLLLGERLGDDGREFTRWTIEELTAWGRVAYRKEDNSFIPMLYDGTNLEGYVLKRDSDCGPRGTVLKTTPAGSSVFWLYALAYRLTGNEFMWEMADSVAKGNDLGHLGRTVEDKPQLHMSTDCSEPHALIGFLELYERTKNGAFLDISRRIGDNILLNRLRRGFFAPDAQHIYARVDAIESLALLHLHAAVNSESVQIPTIWPSWVFFESEYRQRGVQSDSELIYTLTDVAEPPILLYEAVAMSNLDLVKALVAEGADVNSKAGGFASTPLHRAVSGGHMNIVQFLLSEGADVNARGGWRWETPLHYAAEGGYVGIIDLLLTAGASINAANSLRDTPVQYAMYKDNKEIIDLLLQKGAMIANLHIASCTGDLEKAEAFIKDGADMNALDGHGYAPLHYAAQNNQREAIELLVAKGADVNVRNWGGETPLFVACGRGHTDIAELLLSKGANISVADNAGDTLLHRAARDGNLGMIELVIAKGTDVNARNSAGQTPLDIVAGRNHKEIIELLLAKGAMVSTLHQAARLGDLDRVKAFLEKGSDVNAKDKNAETALHVAANSKRKDAVELLVSNGADINAKDKEGYTPLYYAIWNEDANMVRLLVDRGADVNVLPNDDGTPLEYAVWNKDLEMAKLFVAKGARFDVKDHDGWTAFRYAVSGGHRGLVEFFVAKGADVSTLHVAASLGDLARVEEFLKQGTDIDVKDEMDWTPLYCAASLGRTEVATFLIAHGASVRAEAEDGSTPLHQAAHAGDRELVDLMLSKGADVKAKTKRGSTPLHSAASAGHREVVELLIAKGAEINAKTAGDRTPLHNAVLGNQKAVVELLIKAGADASMKDRQGRTPLAWAEQRGYKEIADMLRKHGAHE